MLELELDLNILKKQRVSLFVYLFKKIINLFFVVAAAKERGVEHEAALQNDALVIFFYKKIDLIKQQ